MGYLNHLSRFRLLPGAAAAIRRLNEAALPVIVVTNQSGVGRGYFPEQLVRDVHDRMNAELLKAGARLDGVYYCPHVSADECECRKPKAGMLQQAAREMGLELKKSFVVGDRHSDVEVAHLCWRAQRLGANRSSGEWRACSGARKTGCASRSSWLLICPRLSNGFCGKCGHEALGRKTQARSSMDLAALGDIVERFAGKKDNFVWRLRCGRVSSSAKFHACRGKRRC